MRILIVGSDSAYAIERYYRLHLAAQGAEVKIFPSADIVFARRSRNLATKILFKAGLRTHYSTVNRQLLAVAAEYRPDVIWVFKGMEVFPETLRQLGRSFRLANYNPDHPFIISSRGSGNANVTRSVGVYHLHFCYHRTLLKQIEQRYGVRTVFLPFAYETTDMVYSEEEVPETGRVCFQANPDDTRVRAIARLGASGIGVDVYGHGWHKTPLRGEPNVRIAPILSRPEFWRKNQEYRVQLNLFRAHNDSSHNMRTFEIPAVGGIQLTPFSEEQAEFFEAEQEIFFFRREDEMVAQARRLLGLSLEQARTIRRAARKRSLDSHYTFADRARTVFDAFCTIPPVSSLHSHDHQS